MKKKIRLVDNSSTLPKYRQIVKSIKLQIKEGSLKRGDSLPSINTILDEYGISRDTLVKAFDELKRMGVLRSVHGKGNYIASEKTDDKYSVH